jgi:hypothetical protein
MGTDVENKNRLKLVNVSIEIMNQLLQLPPRSEVVRIAPSSVYHDAVSLVIRNPDFPELAEATKIPEIEATGIWGDDGRMKIQWEDI